MSETDTTLDRDIFYEYLVTPNDYKGNSRELFEKAWKLIDELKYLDALDIFTTLSDEEDIDSFLNLAGMYESYPPIKNLKKAEFFYKKAISGGSTKAAAYLGENYRNEGNFTEAFKLLSKAALKNDLNACSNISRMYALGQGVEENLSKAIEGMGYVIKNRPERSVDPGYDYFTLGWYYYLDGRDIESHKNFEIAFEKQPPLAIEIFKFFSIDDDFLNYRDEAKAKYWEDALRKQFPEENITLIRDNFEKTKMDRVMEANENWDRMLEHEDRERQRRSSFPCFIATAVYQNPSSPELDILRDFRDSILKKSYYGRKFVAIYYRKSPKLAKFIGQRKIIRYLLLFTFFKPIIYILRKI